MEQLVKRIVTLAGNLDKISSEHADVADDIALSLVKTAQYVGSQGYWIRNERCWSNCYRQKRASTPKKASQEIWFECQSEYQDSINDDGGSWDKYANSSLDIKVANKINENPDSADVIDQMISEASVLHRDAYLSLSEKMLNIAEDLHESHQELYKEAASIGAELLKEAGWFDRFKKKQNPVPPNNLQNVMPLNQDQKVAPPAAPVQPQFNNQIQNPSTNTTGQPQQPSAKQSDTVMKLQQKLLQLRYDMAADKVGQQFLKLPNGPTKDNAIATMQQSIQTAWTQINTLSKQCVDAAKQAMQSAIQNNTNMVMPGDNAPPSNNAPAGAVPNFGSNPGQYVPLGPSASNKQKVLFKL